MPSQETNKRNTHASPTTIHHTFFLHGLFNNLSYVLMLSAARSLLPNAPVALVLLFDDTPALLSQALSPLLLHTITYRSRIWIIWCTTTLSLILGAYCIQTADPSSMLLPLLATSLTSISFGIGESTFFSILSLHPPDNVGWFASGTGASGVVGTGLYLLLLALFNASAALLICAALFTLHVHAFLTVILPNTKTNAQEPVKVETSHTIVPVAALEKDAPKKPRAVLHVLSNTTVVQALVTNLTLVQTHWRRILVFFPPLFLVYVATFYINHVAIPHLMHGDEHAYVLCYFLYQLAVFCSRSSLPLLKLTSISQVWVLVVVQMLIGLGMLDRQWNNGHSTTKEDGLLWGNASTNGSSGRGMLLNSSAVPSTGSMLGLGSMGMETSVLPYETLVVVVGLISGVVYVNVFHLLRNDGQLNARGREVVMGITVTATTAGPIVAALIGLGLGMQ